MQDALKATMEHRDIVLSPMQLKSGYVASYMIIDNLPQPPIESLSVGIHGRAPDPADAERIAKAMFGEYLRIEHAGKTNMLHFMKTVKV